MSVASSISAETCWVIGNGPSLRGFDFKRLNGHATLGMNAAYRYWREIDWYPTYYSCLDDELTATHWRQIIELVREKKVRKAFVSGSMIQYDRSIVGDDRFVFLDQFIPYWHRVRAKEYGLPFIDSPFFKSSQGDKITTGSHSVRFAAHLGYRRINLMGIDLKYVEKIPEADQVGDIGLRIRETPKHNPNYFFDGYQQAGDRYNIPNPKEHHGDLHFASLRVTRDDFARMPNGPVVTNCNAQSRLFEERVFPYMHVDRMINDRPLSAVVVPTTLKETDALVNQMWLIEHKNFAPDPTGQFLRPALTYVFNSGDTSAIEGQLREQFAKTTRLKAAFEEPTFINIGLEGEQDQYIRDYTKPAGRFGYKAGPNNQFFETLARHALNTHYIFLMESDCIPIRPGWLDRMQSQLHHTEPTWIMGSAYRGRTTLGEAYKRHLNGNAVYAAGDRNFQLFIETFWRPELERLIQRNPRIAYDCALEILMGEALSEDPDNPTWRLMQEVLHLMRFTDMIQNRSGARDSWDMAPDLPAQLFREDPEAYLLHGKPFADGVAAMRKAGGEPDVVKFRIARSQPPVPENVPAKSVMKVTHSDAYPRLLVFDHTCIGDSSATGELKASLFLDWPKSQYMQVHGGHSSSLGVWHNTNNSSVNVAARDQRTWLKSKIAMFRPEMIIYRPVPDTLPLHDFAMEVINEFDLPVVVWIMDDWPSALRLRDPQQFEKLDRDWRLLVKQSAGALSIGESMSRAFQARYGIPFEPAANGIEPSQWPRPSGRKKEGGGVVIRYSGSLSVNMGLESIVQVAQAVETLAAEGLDVRFEIKARAHWLETAGKRFEGLSRTSIRTDDLPAEAYRAWLSQADVVLIAYNFDEASKDYVRYSIANKLPECLASGATLLAIGPPDIASIELLNAVKCGVTVETGEAKDVLAAVRELATSPEKREELVQAAYKVAMEKFDIRVRRRRFADWLRQALRGSYENLPLKIVRASERRRWAFDHPKPAQGPRPAAAQPAAAAKPHTVAAPVAPPPPAPAVAPAKPDDAYIRATVIATAPNQPAARPAAVAPQEQAVAAPRPLTLFPIASGHANGAVAQVNGSAEKPVQAISLDITEMRPEPAIQATAKAEQGVVNGARSTATPQAGPATAPAAAPARSGWREAVSWARSHVRRSRMAQMAVVALAVLLLGFAGLLAMPAQGDLRPMLIAIAGFAVIGVGGLYFAYRTLSLARRLSAENVEMQKRLTETATQLVALQRDVRRDSTRQSMTVNAIATRIETAVASNARSVDARLTEFGGLSGVLSGDLAALREGLVQQAKAGAAAADRHAALELALQGRTARLDAIEKRVAETVAAMEARALAAAGAEQAAARRLSDTQQQVAIVQQQLEQAGVRLDVLGQDIARLGEIASRAGDDAVAQVAAVAARLAEADRAAVALTHRMDDVQRNISDIAVAAQRVDGETQDQLAALTGRLSQWETQGEALAARVEDAERGTRELAQASQRGNDEARQWLSGLADRLAETRAEIEQLSGRIDDADASTQSGFANLDRWIGAIEERAAELASRVDAGEAEAKAVSARIGEGVAPVQQALASVTARLDGVAAEASAFTSQLDGLSRRVDLAQGEARQGIAGIDQKIGALGTRVNADGAELRQTAAALQRSLADLVTRVNAADDRGQQGLAALSQRLDRADDASGALVARVDQTGAAVDEATAALGQKIDAAVATAEAADAVLRQALSGANDRIAALHEALHIEIEKREDVAARVMGLTDTLRTVDEDTRSAAASLGETVAGLTERLTGVGETVTRVGADVTALNDALSREITKREAGEARVAGLAGALQASDANAQAAAEAAREAVAGLAERLAAVGAHAAKVDAGVKALHANMADRFAAMREMLEIEKESSAGLAGRFNQFDALTRRAIADVSATVAERFEEFVANADKAQDALAVLWQRVADIASLSEGATSETARALGDLDGKVGSLEASITAFDARMAEDLPARLAEIERLMESARDAVAVEVASATAGLADADRMLDEALEAERERIAIVLARLSEVDGRAEAAVEGLVEIAGQVDALGEVARSEQQRVSNMVAKLNGVEGRVTAGTETLRELQGAMQAHAEQTSGRIADLEGAVSANLADKVAATVDAQAEIVRRVESAERTAAFDNAVWFQHFNRRLQRAHIETLEREWARKLSVQASRPSLGYMAARAVEVERELEGRLATSIEDVLLRTMVARATKGASIDVLEIGTLFGVGAAIMYDGLKNHFDNVRFTLLDPLEGYYSEGRPDILTGEPVTERVLRRNLARVGMREDELRVIQRLSTDVEAIREASDRLYDVLVIDADHSYGGVKADFENYGRMVKLGGYVIFDDYGSEDWPDVKAYVDAEISSVDFLAPVGATWRTSVFRVVKQPSESKPARRVTATAKPASKPAPKKAAKRKAAAKTPAKRARARRK